MLVARAHKARAGAVLTRVLRLGFSVASLALLSVRSEAHEPSRVGVPILTALRVTALQDRVLAEYDIALEATSVTTPLRMTFGYGSPGVYSSASAAVVFETASGQLESIPAAISRTWSPPAGLVSIGAKDDRPSSPCADGRKPFAEDEVSPSCDRGIAAHERGAPFARSSCGRTRDRNDASLECSFREQVRCGDLESQRFFVRSRRQRSTSFGSRMDFRSRQNR